MSSPPPLDTALLFGADELPRIKRTLSRPGFANYWTANLQADLDADTRFLQEEIQFNEPVKDLARAGNILTRCAFTHLIEGSAAQAELARLALDRILHFQRWDWILEGGVDTVGVMRNGTTLLAVVTALDWLGAEVPSQQRATVDEFIAREAAPAAQRAVFGMTHPNEVKGWTMDPKSTGFERVDVSRWPHILDRTNLRVIATSGLAAAGAHLHERHPEAETWATEARDSLRLFASREQPDASFPEGVSYWHFTYTYFIVSLELLRRKCGIDERGLLDFPAMARYVQCATVLGHDGTTDCVNVSDANGCAGAEPLAWIGRHFRDTTANYLVDLPGIVRDTPLSAWAAIWHDDTVPARRAADAAMDRVLAPGIVLSRSGWGLGDSVLSLRSGEPENHEHADRNSLLFFFNGERLITDPLHASYNPAQSRWQLRLTPAHSAVLIDGKGHAYHNGEEGVNASTARAVLQSHCVGQDWMSAVSEAVDGYQRTGLPAQRVQRTVIYLKPDIVIVLDRIALSESLPVQIRFQAFNEDGKGRCAVDEAPYFTITRPHASLRACVTAKQTPSLTTGFLPVEDAGESYPYVEITSPAATVHEVLTVTTATPTGASHGGLKCGPIENGWRIQGHHGSRTIDVAIDTRPEIPRFQM